MAGLLPVDRRVARVGGGAIGSDLDRATQVHGLATTGGRVSTTGVAGLTLGGGSGWLERMHGLACDNLVSAELVTWDGRIVRASEDENADLLWALRGGGGNFGVVTTLELALHPVGPEIYAGEALFAASRAPEILRRFRDLMNDAPDELSLAGSLCTAPDDPVDDPPGYRNYWTAENLVDLPEDAIDALVHRAAQWPSGLSQLSIVAWGGAVDRFGFDHSPLAGRDARFIVHPLLLWTDPAEDERCRAIARSVRRDVQPWSTGATYPNVLGDEGRARMSAAYGSSAALLAEVKTAWDPHGVFRSHQAISGGRCTHHRCVSFAVERRRNPRSGQPSRTCNVIRPGSRHVQDSCASPRAGPS